MLRYLITLVLAIAGFIAQTQEVLYLSNGSNITITPGATQNSSFKKTGGGV